MRHQSHEEIQLQELSKPELPQEIASEETLKQDTPLKCDEESLHEETVDIEETPKPETSDLFTYQPHVGYLSPIALMLLVTLLIGAIQISSGCSEATSMTASNSNCEKSKDGNIDCTISETTRLVLVPQGQD